MTMLVTTVAKRLVLALTATFNAFVASLAAAGGSALVGFKLAAALAVQRTVGDKFGDFFVSVKDFGAVGDGVADDTLAIQRLIDWLSGTIFGAVAGGGVVWFPPGKYRITSGLSLGWGVQLKGPGCGGFPYTATPAKLAVLIADFGANVNQWVIDSATFKKPSNVRVAYNELVGAALDADFTSLHQVGVSGLHIQANATIPWGAIRLVGCPDAKIRDVTVIGTGIAFMLNTSFTASIEACHSETHYYGVVLYESNNSCRVDGYFNKIINPASLAVPVERVLPFLPVSADMIGVFEIDGSHYQSAKGLVIAAGGGSSSQTAEVSATLEYWPDAVFLLRSYGTVFKKLYAESTRVNFVVSGAYFSCSILSASVFCSNAKLFDVGFAGRVDANLQGLLVVNTIGGASDNAGAENNAAIKLRGVTSVGRTYHPRISWEFEAVPLAKVSFDGATLALKNAYNVTGVRRVAGEPVGDYWIDFVRPSNASGEVMASVMLSGAGSAHNLLGGGDGIQNTSVRVRCVNQAGNPFNPARVMAVIHG